MPISFYALQKKFPTYSRKHSLALLLLSLTGAGFAAMEVDRSKDQKAFISEKNNLSEPYKETTDKLPEMDAVLEKSVMADDLYREISPSEDPRKVEYMAIVDTYLWEIQNSKISDIKDGQSINGTLFKLKSYAKIYHEGQQYQLTDKDKNIFSNYKVQLIAFQNKAFPKMRDVYGPVIREKGWEHDIGGRTFGDGYRTLEVSGFHFANNANIKIMMETISPIVREMRFKTVRFKWSKAADEYQYYNIDSLTDSEISK